MTLRIRTPQEYAIEHAGYLATAATRFLDACNALHVAQTTTEEADGSDTAHEAWKPPGRYTANVAPPCAHRFTSLRRDGNIASAAYMAPQSCTVTVDPNKPDEDIDDAIKRIEALEDVLRRISQWDHLDGASDGPHWRKVIERTLTE